MSLSVFRSCMLCPDGNIGLETRWHNRNPTSFRVDTKMVTNLRLIHPNPRCPRKIVEQKRAGKKRERETSGLELSNEAIWGLYPARVWFTKRGRTRLDIFRLSNDCFALCGCQQDILPSSRSRDDRGSKTEAQTFSFFCSRWSHAPNCHNTR